MSEIAIQVQVPQITEDQRNFLRIIKSYSGAATSGECGLADRRADRVRQKSKRQGLVIFEGRYWHLTDVGRAALANRT